MDFLRPKKLKSHSAELQSFLSTPSKTTEFFNSPRPQLLELSVCLSLLHNESSLYSILKSHYIKEQSNESLEYLTIVSAYASGQYSESLFLARDLLISKPTQEVFLIILKITVNHLGLIDLAHHYSLLALEHNPNDEKLKTARAVVCLSSLSSTLYQDQKTQLLKEAKTLLDSSSSTGKNILFFKSITNSQLGLVSDAIIQATEGFKITLSANYAALIALIMMAQEDYTGSLSIIKRGLQSNPAHLLLYALKLYCKFLLFEHTHDKDTIKKSIRALIKMCIDSPEDENSSIPGAIKEESSNVDSGYFDDIFKDVVLKSAERFQQVIKLCFRISVEIGDFELASGICDKILDNKFESVVLAYFKDKVWEELEEFVENLWACEILAQLKYESGDLSMAVTLSKQAIRLNHNSKRTWMLLGKIYKEQGLPEQAMEAYLSALRSVDINFSLIPIYLEDF